MPIRFVSAVVVTVLALSMTGCGSEPSTEVVDGVDLRNPALGDLQLESAERLTVAKADPRSSALLGGVALVHSQVFVPANDLITLDEVLSEAVSRAEQQGWQMIDTHAERTRYWEELGYTEHADRARAQIGTRYEGVKLIGELSYNGYERGDVLTITLGHVTSLDQSVVLVSFSRCSRYCG